MASTSSSQDLNNETPELNISDFSPILGLELEERTEWEYPAIIFKSLDCDKPHDFKLKLETGVKNGDCLLACFAALLESLHRGCITSKDLEAPAAKMRVDMVKWIKQNWTQYPVFNPEMQVHELMWMAHDMGATPEERAHRGEWPEDTDGRLAKYTAICDRIYFSDTEMLLFSSMMYDKRGISLVFRTWRCTGKGQGQGELISTTPDPAVLEMNGITNMIMVDMAHVGTVDGFSAHYKLLDSASLAGLQEVCQPVKRRRLTKTSERAGAEGATSGPGAAVAGGPAHQSGV